MRVLIILLCWIFSYGVAGAGTLQDAQRGLIALRNTCTVTESPETTCTGGIDEDCDGLIDGADSDCASAWSMEIYFEGTVIGTAYTAGGNDIGFATATLSAEGLVDTTNDLITIDASDEYISFAVTAGDIFNSADGALEAYVICQASTNVNQLFEAWVTNSVDYFQYTINGNNTILTRHEGQNSKNDETTTAVMVDNQAFIIQVKWLGTGDNATDILSTRIDINADGDFADIDEGWHDTIDVDPVRPFTTEPTDIKIGNLNFEYGTTDSCSVSYFKISTDHTVVD